MYTTYTDGLYIYSIYVMKLSGSDAAVLLHYTGYYAGCSYSVI